MIWKRTCHSHRERQNPAQRAIKQADLDMLEMAAAAGEWEAQGLYVFFLPAYCSEMNPIEGEWQHLKRDELVGQMFEGEAELAYTVVIGLEDRGEKNGHSTSSYLGFVQLAACLSVGRKILIFSG